MNLEIFCFNYILMNKNNIIVKNKNKYCCEKCNYFTSKKSNYDKHLQTKKHKKAHLQAENTVSCNICGSIFNSRTTLWRHKKQCTKTKKYTCDICNVSFEKLSKYKRHKDICSLNNIINEDIMKSTKKDDAVDKLMELLPKMAETLERLAEQPSSINTNCNNNMTINMYLNQECKDAMNLKDFVNKVTISIEDLMYTQNNGYIEGISNIFIKNLNDMSPNERPIHCSHKNKCQFYIKDEDEWNQDKNNKKINNSIKLIEKKQILKIKEWEKLHPNYLDDGALTTEWQNMFRTAFHDDEVKDLECIHKNVSDVVVIEEITKV